MARRIPLFLVLWTLGCQGRVGGESPARPGRPGGGPEVVSCADDTVGVGARPLRRLTPGQWQNTVRDLVGDPTFTASYDDTEPVINDRGVRQLRDSAEDAVARRAMWTEPVFACDVDGAEDPDCAAQTIERFGARAFRRPLRDDERTWLQGVYGDLRAELPFDEAMEALVEVILQSPQVVYFDETGGTPGEVRELTDHELATRLSYFLWNRPPDAELRGLADDGRLEGDALRAQARRLLADPAAEQAVQDFMWSWMQLDGGRQHFSLDAARKDEGRFPQDGPELRAAMRTELRAFVRRVLVEEQGDFTQLLTDRRAYVNGPLAALYGVDGPADADTWEWVELPAGQRAGLLTRAAFLTVYAGAEVPSPIRRGVYVLENVLCQHLDEPPANASDVPVVGGEIDGQVLTVRQDVEAKTQGSGCQHCHGLINPIGFAFGHYDAMGAWMDVEHGTGLDIDSSGWLTGTDSDREVADALELSATLAASGQVRSCFAEHWVQTALGSIEGEDQCAVRAVQERFAETGDFADLIVAIVESDAFRYVRVEE